MIEVEGKVSLRLYHSLLSCSSGVEPFTTVPRDFGGESLLLEVFTSSSPFNCNRGSVFDRSENGLLHFWIDAYATVAHQTFGGVTSSLATRIV